MGKSINAMGSSHQATPLTHCLDESPAGYSWAGCSPAEPTCASPASFSISGPVSRDNQFSANGIVSLSCLSQPWGPEQSVPFSNKLLNDVKQMLAAFHPFFAG